MNNFKVNDKRQDMQFEIAFTEAHKAAKKKYSNKAEIELAALKAQYPAILHDVMADDLFVGRHDFGAVGYGIQHQTGGFGFFIHEDQVVNELENAKGTMAYREALHDLLVYWRRECTDKKVMNDMPDEIREALPSDDWIGESLPAVPILRMAGTYMDFDKLVQIGIPGLEAEVAEHIEKAKVSGGDVALFESMLGALTLFKDICDYYIARLVKLGEDVSEERKEEFTAMIQVLNRIKSNAPETLREAVQLTWLYGLLTPAIEYGRMDVYLADLYVKDIDSGLITEEEALSYIQNYFRLIDHLDCETDGRVIVGGYGRRNPENGDRFSLVAIEACRTVKEVLPQFTLRFNKETPKEVWDAAMKCIEEGRTYPLLYNDDVLVPGVMEAFDVDRERALSYMPLGCGEIEFDHYSFGTPSGSLNALKILELTLRGGFDHVSGKQFNPKVKGLEACESYEEFYAQYQAMLKYYIEAQAAFEAYQYKKVGEMHPYMFVSMLYDGCLDSGKAIFDGGCQYYAGTLEVYGYVNAADSLAAIKKLVFEERTITAEHMMATLEDNFFDSAYERKLMLDAPKYGNDDAYVDDIAVELHGYINKVTKDSAPKVGLESYLTVYINNAQNTTLARWVGATPDGRKSGIAMANANNPAPGQDKTGVTAMLNSLLKLPTNDNAGMVQNVRFTRELYKQSSEKVHTLIDSYFDRGGAQAMITVLGKEDLKNALDRPEEYKDLIVRVGGFSARFVELQKDVQKEIYERVTY